MKSKVRQRWERELPGERRRPRTNLPSLEKERYERHPYLPEWADFESAQGKRILEIGTGLGVDFAQWSRIADQAIGIDFTSRAAETTNRHLNEIGADESSVFQADAENLPFADSTMDIVYSFGVLHHTPDIGLALQEISRVIKSDGVLKLMLYGIPSITGILLWLRFGLPRFQSQKEVIANHLESPGTMAFRDEEATELIENHGFEVIDQRRRWGHSDLLQMNPSERFDSAFIRLVWRLYPSFLIKQLPEQKFGFFNLIHARKR